MKEIKTISMDFNKPVDVELDQQRQSYCKRRWRLTEVV